MNRRFGLSFPILLVPLAKLSCIINPIFECLHIVLDGPRGPDAPALPLPFPQIYPESCGALMTTVH